MSKASDMYAFGFMMFEMLHGSPVWAGRSVAQLAKLVAVRKDVLQFSPPTPMQLKV